MQRRATGLMHVVKVTSREKGTIWKVSGKWLPGKTPVWFSLFSRE